MKVRDLIKLIEADGWYRIKTRRGDRPQQRSEKPLFPQAKSRYGPVPSIRPILYLQTRHLAEILQIAGNQGGAVGQRDGGDEQIGSTDLLELLVLPQPVELQGNAVVNEDYLGDGSQMAYRLVEPQLSTNQFRAIGGFQQHCEATLQCLDTTDDRDSYLVPFQLMALDHPAMAVEEQR